MMASITLDELMELWRSVVDEGFAQPFINGKAAGVDTQIEAFEQVAAQLERASTMIQRTTQAMFILPWSGQDDEPAGGARQATVELTLRRTRAFERTVTFVNGVAMFAEVVETMGENGAVEFVTGRRFVATVTTTFGPGEAGDLVLAAASERPGYGYNLCEPGAIKRIVQVGAGLSNSKATVVPGSASHRLLVAPDPDVVIPEHVGQYVEFIAGANAGQVRRVIGYERPNPIGGSPHGGVAILAATGVFQVSAIAGPFMEGEEVTQTVAGVVVARGVLMRLGAGDYMVVERSSGSFVVGVSVVGTLTGASAMLDAVDQSPDLIAEKHNAPPGAPGASWRVLDWVVDLGFEVENAASPEGGRSSMLDELGSERKIYRQPGESDDSYRKRIATVADKVSPNAIRRIANHVFAAIGGSACVREVGIAKFRGLFLDGDPSTSDPAVAFAFDLDFGTRPQDRFKILVDYLEMRAFFLVGVPPVPFGDYGCAFDVGVTNAFDCAPWLAFFDGSPLSAQILYRTAWAAIDDARAAGVGFDLYLEGVGCI